MNSETPASAAFCPDPFRPRGCRRIRSRAENAATPRLAFDKAAARFPGLRAAGIPALLRRSVWPRARARQMALGLSNRCAAARSLQETRLLVGNAIALRMLLRRAIEQHLLQFLHRARVNHRHLPILQPRVALSGQNQPLNVRRRERFSAAGGKHHSRDQTIARPRT